MLDLLNQLLVFQHQSFDLGLLQVYFGLLEVNDIFLLPVVLSVLDKLPTGNLVFLLKVFIFCLC